MSTLRPPASPEDGIRRAWRDTSDDQPPARIDAAILAAARAAVADDAGSGAASVTRARPAHWFTRWQPLAAAAAVAGLAFALLQTLPRDRDMAPPPAIRTLEPAASAPPAATAEESVSVPGVRDLPTPAAAKEAAASSPATAGKAAVAGPPLADQAGAEVAADHATAHAADAPASAAPPAARTRTEAEERYVVPSAGLQVMDASPAAVSRIDAIVALYRAGDETRAASELRALRADDPEADSRLPDAMREWAKTVR
jgi:hypothetical protein